MDKQKAAADIIAHALPQVPFEGWNQQVLGKAALAAGYRKTDAIRVFPGGAIDAADVFMRQADDQMVKMLHGYHLETMKIRERIALAVRLRLEAMEPHREAARRTVALQSLPFYCAHGLRSLYRTVDTIWYEAGDDKSTDFNFYTKRLLLAGVYSATLRYWLDDQSPGHEASWAFLDRRIADVMQIEKAKYRMKSWFTRRRRRGVILERE